MALSRRKSKDLLLDGRMRPYQNSIAYQKEKGKNFFRKICTFSWFFRKEDVIGGLEHIPNGTKQNSGDVLDATFDLHQRFSGERHAQKLILPIGDGGGLFDFRFHGYLLVDWNKFFFCFILGNPYGIMGLELVHIERVVKKWIYIRKCWWKFYQNRK